MSKRRKKRSASASASKSSSTARTLSTPAASTPAVATVAPPAVVNTTAVMVPPLLFIPKKKIFISWSGEISKEIARQLKVVLENVIFPGTGLECFVSDVDIISGEDWWDKIKSELNTCDMGIVCITKENYTAPWIYFESGALVARELRLKPLLFNCNEKVLRGTPIAAKHMVDFYKAEKFRDMVRSINSELKLRTVDSSILDDAINAGYITLKDKLSKQLAELKKMRVFNESYVYPSCVKTVNLKTLYICAAMSSLSESEYCELRDFIIKLRPVLIDKCGFTSVESPVFDKESPSSFDGKTKAIRDNFRNMKQVDSMLVIYPRTVASSVLVEIGYGLALSKKTVIFHREDLPYILEEAGTNIQHIDTRRFDEYSAIMDTIEKNGRELFEMDEGDA